MMIWWSVTGRKIDRSSRTRSCIGEMMNMKTPEFGLKFGEILHYPRQLSQVTLAQSFGIRLRAGPTALWTPRPIFAAVLSNFQTKNVLVSQRFPCHFHLKDQLKEESYYIVYSSLRGISIRVESSSFHLDLLWQLQLGIHFLGICVRPDLTSPRILPKAHTSWVRQSCFRPRCCGCQGPLSCTILVCWIASGLTWFHHSSIHPNRSKITQVYSVHSMICGSGLCRCISFRCCSLVSCHDYLVCDACDLAKGAVDRMFVPNRSGKNGDGPSEIPKTCMFLDQIFKTFSGLGWRVPINLKGGS